MIKAEKGSKTTDKTYKQNKEKNNSMSKYIQKV